MSVGLGVFVQENCIAFSHNLFLKNYSDEEFCAQPLSTVWLMYATKAELEKDD